MKKRILSFLLVAVMLITILPMTAFAAEEEMSKEFKELLNEKGEFVINMVEPEEFDYDTVECARILYYEYGDVILDYESYDAENSTCNLSLNWEETHNVKIVYNYDSEIKEVADALVATFPDTGSDENYYFRVKDLELINYWLTRK